MGISRTCDRSFHRTAHSSRPYRKLNQLPHDTGLRPAGVRCVRARNISDTSCEVTLNSSSMEQPVAQVKDFKYFPRDKFSKVRIKGEADARIC